MTKWIYLDSGTFNHAYVNKKDTLIFKKKRRAQNDDDGTNEAERAVRIWNELNPTLRPKAFVVKTRIGNGWICPYVKGVQATDEEISRASIDIFNRTGRIIVDATVRENFKKTPNGDIICIDVGMALELEIEEERLLINNTVRRKSQTSRTSWKNMHCKYAPFFIKEKQFFPKTITTIQALLFIKEHRPDIYSVNFLRNKSHLIDLLAQSYKNDKHAIALQQLSIQVPLHFMHLQKSCIIELERYIHSRGQIKGKEFTPSLITYFFRNSELTQKKVFSAYALINNIKHTETLEELVDLLQNARQENEIYNTQNTRSGLAIRLGKCLRIVETGEAPKEKSICHPLFSF